ncbi:MAG: helix-hairpin-helix domain-containing protein [Thermotogae bacterium]|nr:helix-hairpin-helix domain-containing protein [Thermotogota bacterium]
MCGNLFKYLKSLFEPSPQELKGAFIILIMALLGLAYSIYKDLSTSPKVFKTYEAERIPPPQDLPVDTTYFLYERKLYTTRKRRPRKVNVNRAGVRELVSLPGVGPVIARRIVEYRKKHGAFKKPEDLLKIKGIGHKKLQKMKPYILL